MIKIFVIAALIAAVVLFASLVGMIVFSSEQSNSDNRSQPPIAESKDGKNDSARADKETSNSKNESQHKRDWYYTFIDHPTDWLLVLFNGLLVLATIALFVSGERNVDAARRSAHAAREAAEAAGEGNRLNRDAFITAQRPWLTVEALPGPGGLGFDEENGMLIFITFNMKNIGNSPAVSVIAHASVEFDWVPSAAQSMQDIMRDRIAGYRNRATGGNKWGLSIQRGETRQEIYNVNASKKKVVEATKVRNYVMPVLLFIVEYQFMFDDTRHYTAVAYDVRKKPPDPPRPLSEGYDVTIKPIGGIAEGELIFTKDRATEYAD